MAIARGVRRTFTFLATYVFLLAQAWPLSRAKPAEPGARSETVLHFGSGRVGLVLASTAPYARVVRLPVATEQPAETTAGAFTGNLGPAASAASGTGSSCSGSSSSSLSSATDGASVGQCFEAACFASGSSFTYFTRTSYYPSTTGGYGGGGSSGGGGTIVNTNTCMYWHTCVPVEVVRAGQKLPVTTR